MATLESIEAKLDQLLAKSDVVPVTGPISQFDPKHTAPPPGFVWGENYRGEIQPFPATSWGAEQLSYIRDGVRVMRYGVQFQPVPADWLQPLNDTPEWFNPGGRK